MKSRVFAGLGFFLCILPLAGLGAPRDREVVLLAAECQNENGGCARQDLVAYTFRNGKQVAKDTVLTSDVLSFNLGENQIYQDRYVITHWADVIDLPNKKLLHKGDGQLVGLEGDRVIEYVRKWEIDGYFYFDLKTGERGPLTQPGKWALPGVLSPKQTKSVSACEISVNRIMGIEVWMFTADG
ncbi:MAG TPA: hypothetical protein VLV54_19215, partial [Thermoanaerobaculia bacterium]|nr:hypothetical protein [Thermoanaerobaculia bacterium]